MKNVELFELQSMQLQLKQEAAVLDAFYQIEEMGDSVHLKRASEICLSTVGLEGLGDLVRNVAKTIETLINKILDFIKSIVARFTSIIKGGKFGKYEAKIYEEVYDFMDLTFRLSFFDVLDELGIEIKNIDRVRKATSETEKFLPKYTPKNLARPVLKLFTVRQIFQGFMVELDRLSDSDLDKISSKVKAMSSDSTKTITNLPSIPKSAVANTDKGITTFSLPEKFVQFGHIRDADDFEIAALTGPVLSVITGPVEDAYGRCVSEILYVGNRIKTTMTGEDLKKILVQFERLFKDLSAKKYKEQSVTLGQKKIGATQGVLGDTDIPWPVLVTENVELKEMKTGSVKHSECTGIATQSQEIKMMLSTLMDEIETGNKLISGVRPDKYGNAVANIKWAIDEVRKDKNLSEEDTSLLKAISALVTAENSSIMIARPTSIKGILANQLKVLDDYASFLLVMSFN